MTYDVTIGIPVYNVELYIQRNLECVLNQTFQNIEFLFCDDCSTDGTMDVVRKYAENHARGKDIRVISQPRNQGVGAARNRIIDEARGKYLFFMDSDDFIEPDTIEILYRAVESNHADIAYASYRKVDDAHHLNQVFQYSYTCFTAEDEFAGFVFREYGKFQTTVWNCLMDIAWLRKGQIKFIDAAYWEDMAFTYELVTKVRRAVILPDVTYHYWQRKGSLSNNQNGSLEKAVVINNIASLDYMKSKCRALVGKDYLPYLYYVLGMNSLYVICYALRYFGQISPAITWQELCTALRLPLSFHEVLQFKKKRMVNLVLWKMGHLPAWIAIPTVKLFGKLKGAL